jgi:hypothetical protein
MTLDYLSKPWDKFTDLNNHHVHYYELKLGCASEKIQKEASILINRHCRVLNMLTLIEEWKELPRYDDSKKMWEYRGNWYKGSFEAMVEEFKFEERKNKDNVLEEVIQNTKVACQTTI